MKKIMSLNIVALITAVVVFITVQMLLLHGSGLSSISSIISKAHFLTLKSHLLVLGLLPIYIGLVVFGSATIGVYIGCNFQHFLFHRLCKTPDNQKK